MRQSLITMAVGMALVAGCKDVPNPNVFCDGTSKYPCNDSAFPYCDVGSGRCVSAIPDLGGCTGSVCDLSCGACDLGVDMTSCQTSAQCADVAPICSSMACRACTGPTDDAECVSHNTNTPRCDSNSGNCVACLPANNAQSADCKAAMSPICGAGSICRVCAAHAECGSLVCNSDGSCAAQSDVAYVDNKNGTCTGTHTGTIGDPYCDIQIAIMMSGKSIVRAAGSTLAYGRLTIASGSITIVGPGGMTSPSVKVGGDLTNPAVSVSGSSTAVKLDGIEITGGGAGQDGVVCSSTTVGPALTLFRTYVHNVPGRGLTTSKCVVTVDRTQIGPANGGGGMGITDGTYAVTNSFIVANGTLGPGVALSTGSTGTFRHNSVVNNLVAAGIGGIDCGTGAMKTIENSIVFGNTKSGASQVTTTCSLAFVDIDETSAVSSNRNVAPDFVNAVTSDFHLNGKTANNNSCCIDQIASSPILYDYDGTARPQNVKWDIGAHELK